MTTPSGSAGAADESLFARALGAGAWSPVAGLAVFRLEAADTSRTRVWPRSQHRCQTAVMGDLDLATASAVRTAHAIRDREVSPTEATQAAIERVERLNPQLNAFVYTAFDEALERATEADAAMASGAELGLLHGVPTRSRTCSTSSRAGRQRSAASRC